jgi:hypothetical protein
VTAFASLGTSDVDVLGVAATLGAGSSGAGSVVGTSLVRDADGAGAATFVPSLDAPQAETAQAASTTSTAPRIIGV